MSDPNPITALQRELLKLGCPVKITRRIVREAAEHLEDLEQAGVASGLTPADATTKARGQFGRPDELAQRHMEALRNSSWWGRYPLLGFGLMPLGSVVGVGFLCWLWNMSGFPLAPNFTRFPIHYPWLWTWSFPLFCGFVMALIGLVTVYYCRHCLQAGLGKRWIWAMGGLLALHGLCLHIDSRQVVNLESPPVVLRDEKTALHGKISITFLPPTDLASGSRPMDLSGALSVFKVRHPIKGAPDEILVLKPGENPGYNPGDEWVPADNVMLSDQIAAGWADIQQRQLFEAEDFLSEPGWTASVHPLSTEKYPRSFQKFISSNVEFGHFVWLGEETIQAPLPTLAYGWPRLASNGGWPSWINAALPLLIVAVMLACQKRTGQRLQVDLACANLTAV